jgi:hypothetical protein
LAFQYVDTVQKCGIADSCEQVSVCLCDGWADKTISKVRILEARVIRVSKYSHTEQVIQGCLPPQEVCFHDCMYHLEINDAQLETDPTTSKKYKLEWGDIVSIFPNVCLVSALLERMVLLENTIPGNVPQSYSKFVEEGSLFRVSALGIAADSLIYSKTETVINPSSTRAMNVIVTGDTSIAYQPSADGNVYQTGFRIQVRLPNQPSPNSSTNSFRVSSSDNSQYAYHQYPCSTSYTFKIPAGGVEGVAMSVYTSIVSQNVLVADIVNPRFSIFGALE